MSETMQRCGGCRRHVAAHEQACPFCRARVGLVGASVVLAMSTMLAGCSDRGELEGGGSGAETSSASTSTTTDGSTSGTATTATTAMTTMADSSTSLVTGVTESTGEADTDVSSVGFIYGDPDTGESPVECDVWSQDCADGEKCVPWANDGGDMWNAARCTPVARDPHDVGESCTVEGSPYSGIDDCVEGAICWDVDAATLAGTCVAQCGGNEAAPECADGLACLDTNNGVLTLCLPTCQPVVPECVVDEVCVFVGSAFLCVPQQADTGQYGDPCEGVNACDPGLLCLGATAVAGCEDPQACCAEVCDLDAADPDAQCTGMAAGEQCTPWYQDGEAPPGYENVGVCALPGA